jgi:hypothetical protein
MKRKGTRTIREEWELSEEAIPLTSPSFALPTAPPRMAPDLGRHYALWCLAACGIRLRLTKHLVTKLDVTSDAKSTPYECRLRDFNRKFSQCGEGRVKMGYGDVR